MTPRYAIWVVISFLAVGCFGSVVHAEAPQYVGFGLAGLVTLFWLVYT